ncbi:MAG: C40 family peptidase [Calditrichales bacterium]|nr:C40 family peptidase [Calditrichales bacterium]
MLNRLYKKQGMVKYILFITAFFLFTACTGTRSNYHNRFKGEDERQIKQKLLAVSHKWLNTPYRYGGTDSSGIDCSSLAQHIFKKAFRISLPRTASQQMAGGKFVRMPWLKPGDLVFFKNIRGAGADHVGVYLGGREFIHVSSKKGVIISDLSSSHYKKRFVSARRYLP